MRITLPKSVFASNSEVRDLGPLQGRPLGMLPFLLWCALVVRAVGADVQVLVKDQTGRPVEGAVVWAEGPQKKMFPPLRRKSCKKTASSFRPLPSSPWEASCVFRIGITSSIMFTPSAWPRHSTSPSTSDSRPKPLSSNVPASSPWGAISTIGWPLTSSCLIPDSSRKPMRAAWACFENLPAGSGHHSRLVSATARRAGSANWRPRPKFRGTDHEVAAGLSADSSGRQRRRLSLKTFFSSFRGRLIAILLLLLGEHSGSNICPRGGGRAQVRAASASTWKPKRPRASSFSSWRKPSNSLRSRVRLLSSDYAFASTFAQLRNSNDPVARATLESALQNYRGGSASASFIRLISSDGQTIIDTLPAEASAKLVIDEELIVRAEDSPSLQATKIEALGDIASPRHDLSAASAGAERLDCSWFSARSRLGGGVQPSERLRDRVPLRWTVSSQARRLSSMPT